MLAAEGRRQKEAIRVAVQLTVSTNRYVDEPAGGPPGSPKRLRAAANAVWNDSEEGVARRADKRQQALALLASKNALKPAGTFSASRV